MNGILRMPENVKEKGRTLRLPPGAMKTATSGVVYADTRQPSWTLRLFTVRGRILAFCGMPAARRRCRWPLKFSAAIGLLPQTAG